MFKPDPRCKICGLPDEIIKSLHYSRLVEGMTLPSLCDKLNDLNVTKNLGFAKFYPTSVNRHFKNHLAPDLAAAYISQSQAPMATRVSSNPQKARDVEDHLLAIVAPENLEIFERLRENMEKLSQHLEVIDSVLPTKDNIREAAFSTDVSLTDAYSIYIAMNKEVRATLAELAKFLNLKAILRKFVEELLREYTHKVTAGFLEEMRYLKEELAPEDHTATVLMREVATNFATKLANATDTVIDRLDRIIQSNMKS